MQKDPQISGAENDPSRLLFTVARERRRLIDHNEGERKERKGREEMEERKERRVKERQERKGKRGRRRQIQEVGRQVWGQGDVDW